MEDFIQKLQNITSSFGAKFFLEHKEIPLTEFLSDRGLLPAIVRRADQLSQLCLGYDLGLSFSEANNAILGVKVSFNDEISDILRLIYSTDVILDLIQSNPNKDRVEVDELLYD